MNRPSGVSRSRSIWPDKAMHCCSWLKISLRRAPTWLFFLQAWDDACSAEDAAVTDPFGLVADEVGIVSERLRQSVVSNVPALGTAAEYFFRPGVRGKRLRPTLLMLMSSALADGPPAAELLLPDHSPPHERPTHTRRRQQRIAEVAELIHVASLLHDDVLDDAATRRGVSSLNAQVCPPCGASAVLHCCDGWCAAPGQRQSAMRSEPAGTLAPLAACSYLYATARPMFLCPARKMSQSGNKLAILAGDFLLARASVTLASLQNTEIVELLSRVLEHLVAGEVMQMAANPEQLTSIPYYLEKTFAKTASLMANSARAVAVLGGAAPDISEAAWLYGRHLGLAFQVVDDVLDITGSSKQLGKPALNDLAAGIATAPVLLAAEEQPALVELIRRKFRRDGDVHAALELVLASSGIARAKALAAEHAHAAAQQVRALPPTRCEHALAARQALVAITQRVLVRTK